MTFKDYKAITFKGILTFILIGFCSASFAQNQNPTEREILKMVQKEASQYSSETFGKAVRFVEDYCLTSQADSDLVRYSNLISNTINRDRYLESFSSVDWSINLSHKFLNLCNSKNLRTDLYNELIYSIFSARLFYYKEQGEDYNFSSAIDFNDEKQVTNKVGQYVTLYELVPTKMCIRDRYIH